MNKILIILLLLLSISRLNAHDFLQKGWSKQVEPVKEKFLCFTFNESRSELQHSFYPWQQTHYSSKGIIWTNGQSFQKLDSLITNKKTYHSRTVVTPDELLIIDYNEEQISECSKDDLENQVFRTARFTPVLLLDYFYNHKIEVNAESDSSYAVFATTINQNKVRIFINKSSCLLEKITILSDDELFGDVLTTIRYIDYIQVDHIYHHKKVAIEKINGKITDTVFISDLKIADDKPTIIPVVENYQFNEPIPIQPEIKTEKYGDNLYLVELKHTDDRVMIAEFDSFFLVAEAPLNSENGELIIKEARKIAPHKPVRYFVFGHYHPHYLGGVRAFVHKGAEIICSDINKDYVSFIVQNARTIHPDSLAVQPGLLQVKIIKDSLTISDGHFDMKIYFIGNRSKHTDDYLIYYFPREKILFQDDLVWIRHNEAIAKAGPRQAGLYHAIQDLNLDVETIIQSWPVQDYGVKTIIPFRDLEESVIRE